MSLNGSEPNSERQTNTKFLGTSFKESAYALVPIGVSVVGATFAVTEYFHSQDKELILERHRAELSNLQEKHGNEIEALKTRLASIERRLGEESFFDIRSFFVEDNRKLSLGKTSKYFSDGFYALDKLEDLFYEERKDIDFLVFVLGEENSLSAMIRQFANASLGRMHTWRSKDFIETDPSSPVKRLFPFINVQRVAHSDVLSAAHSINQQFSFPFLQDSSGDVVDSFKADLNELNDQVYRRDTIGTCHHQICK